ncbi:MAG: tRNA (N(6)-L-threonylcarbamoyladenosine(37)-C(2))-methylthiotransferase MtaB [Planctomycetota bacterium]
MERTFHIETLGCKANQYDSRRLSESLEQAGLRPAEEAETPDVWILNTCTVTHTADGKSRHLIRQAIRDIPAADIYVTGCYATHNPDALETIDGVDGVFDREQMPELVREIAGHERDPGAEPEDDFGIGGFPGRSRAFVKIQDGCDFCCNYCIVCHVRGKPRSMPMQDVLQEAKKLVDQGFSEIVLTGIHLGMYGKDLQKAIKLSDAVHQVSELDGLSRLRLSSLEALEVTPRLLEAMQHPTVCPHLHLPLQSGNDAVLERMGRRYSSAEFARAVHHARDALDKPAITTDLMVGYPRETEDEFAETMAFCRKMNFSRMHVFKFSPRKGTPAAEMDGQVHSRIAKKRSKKLRALGDTLARRWAESFVHNSVRVLLEEQVGPHRLVGYTDRYVRIQVVADSRYLDEVVRVNVKGAEDGTLQGTL